MALKNFTPFWFEGILWFKMVNNEQELKQLFNVYEQQANYSKEKVLTATECIFSYAGHPKFGFASECNGDRTLAQFLE
ncbi:MAG: hypothetical protein COA71_14710 [SAR86 cluster bacterium]|uniref:Uncharacterized protein n=1 Tax=SAR86 cluster bacterium TaxID=2030880 RepID=A0A2A5C5C9_9GAMM|nr:MAG: hypothetical protein COA71_14710 [SAR86 cluster bacterium]